MNGQTDKRMNGQMDERTNGQMDEQTKKNIVLYALNISRSYAHCCHVLFLSSTES